MPWFIFVMLLKVAFEAIRESIAKARKAKPAPCARIASSRTCSTRRMHDVRSPALLEARYVL